MLKESFDKAKSISPEEAKVISVNFVSSIIPQDIFSEFECTSICEEYSGLFSYTIRYLKPTQGYTTDERITVFLNINGEVHSYLGGNVCKYETLKEKFDSDKIDSAKDALVNEINSLGLKDLEMDDPIIITNVDGELYIRVDFSYTSDDGYADAIMAFVNVS